MTATMTINTELNGIEIKFDRKPMAGTLELLKKAGFRWHNLKKIWYAKQTDDRMEIAKTITGLEEYAEKVRNEEPAEIKAEKVNKYGVKVGDLFYISWGYEQTNIDFYQVVKIVGESSVIVRAVWPERVTDEYMPHGMAADRVYKVPENGELCKPAEHDVFMKDLENGDRKVIKMGYNNRPCFKVGDHIAEPYTGQKLYESWYY